MTKVLINTYAQKSGAARGAKRAGIETPIIEQQADGRWAVFKEVKRTSRKADGPVAKYRELFAANYGTKSWSEIIKMAVEAGISENTAKTYYYKLKKEAEAASE